MSRSCRSTSWTWRARPGGDRQHAREMRRSSTRARCRRSRTPCSRRRRSPRRSATWRRRGTSGKIVVSMPPPAGAQENAPCAVRGDGTYLVTGGLGALGLEVAKRAGGRWRPAPGAHQPSKASSPEARGHRAAQKRRGRCRRRSKPTSPIRGQVDRLLSADGGRMPPLRGIVHAAGVLDDGVLLQQTWERLRGCWRRRWTAPGTCTRDEAPAARLLRVLLVGRLAPRQPGPGQLRRGQRLHGRARARPARRRAAGAQHQLGSVGRGGMAAAGRVSGSVGWRNRASGRYPRTRASEAFKAPPGEERAGGRGAGQLAEFLRATVGRPPFFEKVRRSP
jgi:hypothetical protein